MVSVYYYIIILTCHCGFDSHVPPFFEFLLLLPLHQIAPRLGYRLALEVSVRGWS